jgi:hypothetical protein
MKIGVAIPCYNGHIMKLFDLFDSIQNQTIIPDQVIVSSSSTIDLKIHKEYNFQFKIVITKDKKNAAQNRNIAASYLSDMDYITFIDADDIMHPQRIEVLLRVIDNCNSDIILHNFYIESELNNNLIFEKIENVNIRNHTLIPGWSGCITHISGYNDQIDRIHHSQVTVKKEIFDQVKFPEELEFHRKEDCIFCHRVFSLPNIKNAYIENKLSYYKPSKTGGCESL